MDEQNMSTLRPIYRSYGKRTSGNGTTNLLLSGEQTKDGLEFGLTFHIEQILMKSLKGRSGIIGKGITDNVMLVWTKSMHRYLSYPFIHYIETWCLQFTIYNLQFTISILNALIFFVFFFF